MSYLIKPWKTRLPFYKEIDVTDMEYDNPSEQNNKILNATQQIQGLEGAYYAEFMYEVINYTHVENENKQKAVNNISNLDPRFVYRIRKGANWKRSLSLSDEDMNKLKIHDNMMRSRNHNIVKMKKPHLKVETGWHEDYRTHHRFVIMGTILFQNSDGGYLSGDQVYFINFNLTFTVIYGLMLAIWAHLLIKYKDTLIHPHSMICTVLAFGFAECFLSIFLYKMKDSKLRFEGSGLFTFIMMLQLFRITFSRILSLVIALGYQIVIKSVEKYHPKIVGMTFLIVVAMTASLAVEQSGHDHLYSESVIFMINAPILLLDLILSFWVIQAYRRTLAYL